jgi:hypothetical protein
VSVETVTFRDPELPPLTRRELRNPSPRRALQLLRAAMSREATLELARDLAREAGPKRLPDGTLGYFGRDLRQDDCFAAAAATVLQVPVDRVPDIRLDEQLAAGRDPEQINRDAWASWKDWLARRTLRLVVHHGVPAARRRWIGVIRLPKPDAPFNDHCVVMTRDRILFDPADFAAHIFDEPDSSLVVRRWRPEHVAYGLSFQLHNQSR